MGNLNIIHLKEVDSTSDYAKKYAANNVITQDILVVSDSQTGGRGRMNGRLWQSPPGNFYGTYILGSRLFDMATIDPRTIALHAIKNYLSGISSIVDVDIVASIKQPNDILIGGKKLSGVLVEMGGPHTFIGIGINLTNSPVETSTNILGEYGVMLGNLDVGRNLYAKIIEEIDAFSGLVPGLRRMP